MWHRFDHELREVVLRALSEASNRGAPAAEARDFETVLDQARRSNQRSARMVGELAPDAVALFERAYHVAALRGDRQVEVLHLLAARGRAVSAPVRPGWLRRTIAGCIRARRLRRSVSLAHPDFSSDPYPLYRQMRATGPVRRDPLLGSWVVTGYAEAVQVLRDKRFSSVPRSSRTPSGTMEVERLPDGPVRRQLATVAMVLTRKVVFTDPPMHTRLRSRLGEVFAGVTEARIERIADELLDRVIPRGSMDLVADFAYPLPLTVVAEMLGLGDVEWSVLKSWSNVFGRMMAFDTPLPRDLENRAALIEARKVFDRRLPSSPLPRLMTGPDAIDADELFANVAFFLAAGHETSTSVISNSVRVLLEHPSQLAMLRRDPASLENAVEELLRLESPIQITGRRATEDVELGGQRIGRGEVVLIALGAANRDPGQFPDPDRFDLARTNASKHLAFSGGGHYCLGAALGRAEVRIGLASLVRRLSNIRLARPGTLRWRAGNAIRTLESLPITFDANDSPSGA